MLADMLRRISGMGATVKNIYTGYLDNVRTADLSSGSGRFPIGASVDLSKSVVLHSLSYVGGGTAYPSQLNVGVLFSDSSNLVLVTSDTGTYYRVNWTVIEFDKGVNVQHGKLGGSSAAEYTVAISPVDLSKAVLLDNGGYSDYDTSTDARYGKFNVWLLDSTTVKAVTYSVGGKTAEAYFSVLEFE